MPARVHLRTRVLVGATLSLVAGCAVDRAPSDSMLGASSGGGAAFFPASRPVPPRPAAGVAPLPAPATAGVVVPREVRPGRSITISAPGGEAMALAAAPAHGTVAPAAGASLRYTPNPGYTGDDQFSLTMPGGRGPVTVSIIGGP